MTGLMPSSYTSPPPWAFELPPQIGEWSWQAPTSIEDRKKRRNDSKLSISRLLDEAIQGLETWGEEKPWSQPPPPSIETSDQSTMALPVEQEAEFSSDQAQAQIVETLPPITDTVSRVKSYPAKVPTTLDDLVARLQDRVLESPNVHILQAACRSYRKGIHSLLRGNRIPSADLPAAVNPFNTELEGRFSSDVLDVERAATAQSIVEAFGGIGLVTKLAQDQKTWLSLLAQTCQMVPQKDTFGLFKVLMDAIPRTFLNDLPSDSLIQITKSFIDHEASRPWRSTPRKLHSHLQFAGAIRRITPRQHDELRQSMDLYLQQSSPPKDRLMDMKYHWVLTMAYDRHTTTDVFLEALATLADDPAAQSCDKLFALLKGRFWAARGIGATDVPYFKSAKADIKGWQTILRCLWFTPEQQKKDELFRLLCQLCQELGCFDGLAKALEHEDLPARQQIVQAIIMALDDHKLALQVGYAVTKEQQGPVASPVWQWDTWSRHVENIIKDPDLDTGTVWRVINFPRTAAYQVQHDVDTGDIRNVFLLLERMTGWFLEATHLTDRQVLRHIERCMSSYIILRRCPGVSDIPESYIVSLAQVVTRDLERGQPGRPARLDYLVSLTRKTRGEEQAEKLLTQIRGWRWTIFNQSLTIQGAKPLDVDQYSRDDDVIDWRSSEEEAGADGMM